MFGESWNVLQMDLNIDGDAGTTAYRFTGNFDDVGFLRYDVTNLAYFLAGRERAAIIGVGGGRDVLSAASFWAKKHYRFRNQPSICSSPDSRTRILQSSRV
jgi:hypothetical protein